MSSSSKGVTEVECLQSNTDVYIFYYFSVVSAINMHYLITESCNKKSQKSQNKKSQKSPVTKFQWNPLMNQDIRGT